jgi:hypothetical protein
MRGKLHSARRHVEDHADGGGNTIGKQRTQADHRCGIEKDSAGRQLAGHLSPPGRQTAGAPDIAGGSRRQERIGIRRAAHLALLPCRVGNGSPQCCPGLQARRAAAHDSAGRRRNAARARQPGARRTGGGRKECTRRPWRHCSCGRTGRGRGCAPIPKSCGAKTRFKRGQHHLVARAAAGLCRRHRAQSDALRISGAVDQGPWPAQAFRIEQRAEAHAGRRLHGRRAGQLQPAGAGADRHPEPGCASGLGLPVPVALFRARRGSCSAWLT